MIARMLGIRIFDVEVSSRCNLHCRFCPREELPETGLMSGETFERFLEHVPLHATDNLAFVGMGEPTLNPRLPHFVRRAKARCPRVIAWVTSNGTRLTGDVVGPLLDAGLDILDVSVNGTDAESYESMMCGANFAQTVANLESTRVDIERRACRTRLQVNFVVTEENRSRVGEIKAFWRARGIDRFRLQRMHNRGGTTAVKGMREVDSAGLRGRGCSLFDTMSFIAWTGEVYYCSHDIRRCHSIGNVRTERWEEIRRRKRAIRRTRRWPDMCASCTDPLRHDLGTQIGKQMAAELGGVAAKTVKRMLKRPRLSAGLPLGHADRSDGRLRGVQLDNKEWEGGG